MKRHALLLAFLFAFLVSSSGLCATPVADSTSFDPTAVAVKAQSLGGIPVGTIISWPVAQNPDDFSNSDGTFNWLECNGQSVNATVYPELSALVGPVVPDLRKNYLQGSETPGTFLSAGLPNISGNLNGYGSIRGAPPEGANGAFRRIAPSKSPSTDSFDGPIMGYSNLVFDASQANPIYGNSMTVQPPSYTVRYLIRALP